MDVVVIPTTLPINLLPATLVRFEPSIAGNVPVNCDAGKFVRFAPLPEKLVADKAPVQELK